ncbi:hypothetical protein HPB52_005950 [Rhipicephalus sanguineus]|uniref:Uncharacterized protein n=1 Tax=Rhipicephalus sanguineus TaxID=34632 RepID=A0A9D4PK56_RHISA|nr:hypothetical protein HPB52_005950 [Rhipicephalus sanguineus]
MEGEAFPHGLLPHGLACTKRGTRVCQLVQHLTACNEALWHARLQLREDISDELGELSVVAVPRICEEFPCCDECANNQTSAPELLRQLLESHRCIVSLESNYDVVNSAPMAEILARSSSLRRLTVEGTAEDPPEVLDRAGGTDDRFHFLQKHATSTAAMEIPVRLLEKDGATLVSLDMMDLKISPSMAKKLMEALVNNDTLEELAVGDTVFYSGPDGGTVGPFVRYLTKSYSTLRKLTIRVSLPGVDIAELQTLARAISGVTTLEDLTWYGLVTRLLCTSFLEAVTQSRSLRSLKFLLAVCLHDLVLPCARENTSVPGWVTALRENSTLQNLDVDVSWFSSTDCCLLLEALAKGNSIQSVTLRYFSKYNDLVEVCRAVRDCGLDGKVHIEDYRVVLEDAWILPACRQVRSVDVSCWHSLPSMGVLRNFFRIAASCHHVTSMCVCFYFFDEATFASLAAYIRESLTIDQIDLLIEFSEHHHSFIADNDVAVQSMSNLIAALSSNTSITTMHLSTETYIGDRDCQVLADGATNNRKLRKLSVTGLSTFIHVFLDRLLSGLEHSYNLLLLELPFCDGTTERMREAQELVRRNCSLVDRATRFVMGDHSWYCASAFERVSEEPVLVTNVGRKVNATEEAENMIRGAQKSVRLMNIHDYMKLTGVVEGRVECVAREDGRPQLDQLHYDCWLIIRRYLMIEDVLKP